MSRTIGVKRYEMVDSPPPAWTWDDYSRFLSKQWAACLRDASSEQDVQDFLELHPCVLPGGEGGGDSFGGHHGPLPGAVVRQPELPGLNRPVPDFLWVTRTSAGIHPVLIEIEDPRKRWFTKAGHPRSELTQARNQLSDWKTWFSNPAHQILFSEKYVLDDYLRRWLPVVPRYVLVYGRRADAEADRQANRSRANQQPNDVLEMTYDRLAPQLTASNCVTVHAGTSGWTVVNIPPTFRLGPNNADDLNILSGWEKAIGANNLITTERQRFLLERLAYWQEYAREGGGLHDSQDWE
jgi:hypothetical protein